MDRPLMQDLNQLEDLLKAAQKKSAEFLNEIDGRPTSTHYVMDHKNQLPTDGLGAAKALAQFNERFDKAIVSSTGPRYWGYVTGGATPAAILGDWLASVYDQNPQTMKGDGDISGIIERETIHLLLDLFNLPKDFMGGFVTGATLSNFTSLGVARQWLGKRFGVDIARDGISKKMKIVSATPHSSSIKSLSMLGLGSSNVIKIKTMPGNREAMDMDDLKKEMADLNGEPFILIASAGTVNTVDFDDFEALATLKKNHPFWLHIDAAFGGFAACSPLHQHLLKGWESADSITIDCHKWLNVPYESAFFLVNKAHRYQQIETFQNANAPYLGDPLENFNYLNFLPENSRRLRALPAWFTLMAYGRTGYREMVENCIHMARTLGDFIEKSDGFELLSPVRLNTVCFTLADHPEKSSHFLDALNQTGKVFMTPTVYGGKQGIRAAFVNFRTREKDIHIAIEVMNKVLASLNFSG